jgi:hypothetical protein
MLNRKFLILIIFTFILNGYYFYNLGVPILQIIGFTILLFIIMYRKKNLFFKKIEFYLITLLLIYYSTWIIISLYFVDNIVFIKALIGIILSFIVFLLIASLNIKDSKIYNVLTILIFIILSFWFVQFFAYYIYHYRIDYFIDIVGYKQRTNFGISSISFFRPSSLFVEPAMYTNAILILFYYRILYNNFRFRLVDYFILFTIIFTMSLYGYITFLLLLLFIYLRDISIKRYFFILIILFLVIFTLYQFIDNPIVYRIFHPLANQSGSDRLIGNIYEFIDLNVYKILFGFGLGNAEYNGFYGGNALYYLLYNTGIIGLIFYLLIFFIIFIRYKYGFLSFLVFILTLLNNTSVLTSMYNLFMFAVILQYNKSITKKALNV